MLQHSTELGDTPFWHLWVPKGAEMTFLRGEMPFSSRTGVGINVRRAWRTIARGAAKPWEPSGPAVCKTSVAYLRKQLKLALFSPDGKNFADKRPPFWGPENGPQNGGQVVRTQANQIETE